MRLSKCITTGLVVTVFALAYVHQRIEIIKAGYSIRENRICLMDLIDQNSKLTYNLSRLESPGKLLESLDSDQIEFGNQRRSDKQNYLLARPSNERTGPPESLFGRFLDLFTPSAEARTE